MQNQPLTNSQIREIARLITHAFGGDPIHDGTVKYHEITTSEYPEQHIDQVVEDLLRKDQRIEVSPAHPLSNEQIALLDHTDGITYTPNAPEYNRPAYVEIDLSRISLEQYGALTGNLDGLAQERHSNINPTEQRDWVSIVNNNPTRYNDQLAMLVTQAFQGDQVVIRGRYHNIEDYLSASVTPNKSDHLIQQALEQDGEVTIHVGWLDKQYADKLRNHPGVTVSHLEHNDEDELDLDDGLEIVEGFDALSETSEDHIVHDESDHQIGVEHDEAEDEIEENLLIKIRPKGMKNLRDLKPTLTILTELAEGHLVDTLESAEGALHSLNFTKRELGLSHKHDSSRVELEQLQNAFSNKGKSQNGGHEGGVNYR